MTRGTAAKTLAGLLWLALLVAPIAYAEPATIRLATTTSTDNSGLLQELIPPFEQQYGYKVHVIAVGTGKALRMGRDGDVDVVLVHAPSAEVKFVSEGHGVNRRAVMYNDFVLVGPKADPAGVAGTKNSPVALKNIAAAQAVFVSRGDDSGTHKKERRLWDASGATPEGAWYREAGQGMGKVLQIAAELDAYTLTDRGTWIALRDKLAPLTILVENDERLFNPYGVVAVNPARYSDSEYHGAMALIAWITSVPGQAIIRDFRKGGEQMFTPVAVPAE